VHREWLQQAVMVRAIRSIDIESYALDMAKFEAVRFRPRGWGWVDPMKEVEAFKEAVRCGFATNQGVLSQSGEDIEEVYDQLKKERDLAAAAGLVLDTDPANDKPEPAAPKDDPPDKTGEDEDPQQKPGESRVFRFQQRK
jgi:capsid protein